MVSGALAAMAMTASLMAEPGMQTVRVEPDDTVETLHERIKVAERAMLVDNVGRIAREGVSVAGRKVTFGA